MQIKVHISGTKTATFACPRCDNTRTVDVSRYAKGGARARVRSKCTCGCAWTSILERRKSFRISVDIPGRCMYRGDGGQARSIPVRITELSSTGLRIEAGNANPILPSNDHHDDLVAVDFHLNDRNRTHIWKTAYVKNVNQGRIGAEFADSKQADLAIGAFIWGQRSVQADR